MSKSLYDEAIAEAKLLQETAEQNAKNAIIEAVTPKIREFIEDQLIGESADSPDEEILESVASGIMGSDEEIVLDESALTSLLERFGGSDIRSARGSAKKAYESALKEAYSSLDVENQKKLAKNLELKL